MELSLNVGYFGPHIANNHKYIKELDDIGVSCIWTAEAYGYDAVTPLSYFAGITSNIELGAGIMQIPGRTPAMSAMTAVTIDKLSNGRFRLGLGVSGPQVVEGWHGIEYGKPLLKTREYIAVIREILNREKKVTYEGTYYNLPFNGERASGLGKPLKLIEEPLRKDIPIYLAAIGPKNIELSAEITDGWLPFMYSPSKGDEIFSKYLKKGFEKSGVENKENVFEIVATTYAKLCKKEEKETYLEPARKTFALYIGGMGAKSKNFYYNLACEYGYKDIAEKVQDYYLSGNKKEAEELLPDEFIDDLTLVGTENEIEKKLDTWKKTSVTELSISSPVDIETIRFIKQIL